MLGSQGEWFEAVAEHSRDLVAIADDAGRYVYLSPSHQRVLGWVPDELVGRLAQDLIHPDDRDRVALAFSEQLASIREPAPVEIRFQHRDGTYRWVEAVATNLLEDPRVRGVLVNARDVSDRRHVEGLAADQAHILERVARGADLHDVLSAVAMMLERNIPDATGVVLVRHGTSLSIGAAPNLESECQALLEGLQIPDHVEAAPDIFVTSELDEHVAAFRHQVKILDAHGYRASWSAAIGEPDKPPVGVVLVFRPAIGHPSRMERQHLELAANLAGICIERHRVERRKLELAMRDPLTGLANRTALYERLDRVLDAPREADRVAAVIFLDLDRFKVLNDSVGHTMGDELLVALGARLQDGLRATDLVARFGGDEFVVVCDSLADADEAHVIAQHVLQLVEQPFVIGGREVVTSASVGVATVTAGSPDEALRDADSAMYHAKELGRGRVELFDDELRTRAILRLDTERDLRGALDRGELRVYYQPAFEIATGVLAGFEALLRWQHPQRGLLAPSEFLAVADESGLMGRIGTWVLHTALEQAAAWSAAHSDRVFLIGVNIAARQLNDPAFAKQAIEIIHEVGFDPSLLVFEITESAVLTESGTVEATLQTIRGLGVHLALDDFGTGYSSLVHLKRFPIETVKLDQSFVHGLNRVPDDDAIVAALTRLARDLGIVVVAEGVETQEQVDQLLRHGCPFGQGHYWSRAVPPGELEWIWNSPS